MARKQDLVTEDIAKDYINFKLGKNSGPPCNLSAKVLRRLAAELDGKHEDLFRNMLRTLDAKSDTNIDSAFLNIAKEMFADQIVNWGRIAVLYTFAGHMAIYYQRHNMKSESEKVACLLSLYVNSNLSTWILKEGGWDAFNEYFKEKKDENDMFWGNVLCTVTLVAGAAGAALVFAR